MQFLKKYPRHIAAAAVIVVVLVLAFVLADDPAVMPVTQKSDEAVWQSAPAVSSHTAEESTAAESTVHCASDESRKDVSYEQSANGAADVSQDSSQSESAVTQQDMPESVSSAEPHQSSGTVSEAASSVSMEYESSAGSPVSQPSAPEQPDTQPQEIPESQSDNTPPSASESDSTDTESLHCAVTISCAVLVGQTDRLSKNKQSLVPADGIILSEPYTEYSEGETVFDVTKRLCISAGIPFEFTLTPVYNTVYIEGIYNLYEFDCGSGSGWVYSVNGVFPSCGCSDYKLSDGDEIIWHYTCNMGRDVGNTN